MIEITANLLEPSIENPTASEASLAENRAANEQLDTPLMRLTNNAMSGAEVIGILQRYWLLPQVQKELIINEALADIVCSPEEIFSAYQTFYHQCQISSDQSRSDWLERNNCSLVQLEDLVLRMIKLDRFKQIKFGNQINSYFLKHKSQLDQVIYSILQIDDFSIAQELYFRIQEGEATFAKLAPQYSSGQEVRTGGLIGPQSLSIAHPDLVQQLLSMRSGELARPIQIGDSFVVIRLEQHLPAQLDSAMRKRLANELYDQWMQTQLNQLIVVGCSRAFAPAVASI